MGRETSKKKISSYQRLKQKKEFYESELSQLKDEIEHMIEYPYSSRAQGFRRSIKIKLDLI